MGTEQSRMNKMYKKDAVWDELRSAINWGNDIEFLSFMTRNPTLINKIPPSTSRKSVLHLAAMRGRTWMVKMLLQLGAKVDIRDAAGRTPLHDAALFGFLGCTELLLEHGAAIEARELMWNNTPLLEAARGSREAARGSRKVDNVVLFLLRQKANPLAVDKYGHNALNLTQSTPAAKTLLEYDYAKLKQRRVHSQSVAFQFLQRPKRRKLYSPSVAFQLLSSRDLCGKGVLELTKEQIVDHEHRLPTSLYAENGRLFMEKLEYIESFTQARLATPGAAFGDNVDCNRFHLAMAVKLNKELSEVQSVLAQKTYDVLYQSEIHEFALPILGYLSPMDLMSQ